MRYFVFSLSLLLFSCSAQGALKHYSETLVCEKAAAEKISKQSLVSRGKNRTFYLFVPDNLTTARPAPLIVLLHGSGRNGLSLVEKWKELAGKEGVILAGPDSADSSKWSSADDGPDFIHDLVEHLKSKYPINSHRVYLFGHSAGAVYALTLSMYESEYFAATAVHAGAWRDRQEFSAIAAAQRKIPLAIWVGNRDQYFPLEAVRATRDALQAKGFAIDVTEMPGHDHWYYDLAPKINESAWEFLKRYELTAEQRYAEFGNSDDTSRANNLLQDMNNLRKSAYDLSQQAETIDAELMRKDPATERSEVQRLAQQELDLLNKSATMWLEAADKADSGVRLRLTERNAQYLSLIGRHNRKNAEIAKALGGRAEAVLNNHTAEATLAKRNEAILLAQKLQQEAYELQKELDALMK